MILSRLISISILVSLFFLPANRASLYCQSRPFHVESMPEEIGLSQNTVSCVFQDSRGYLWIGTQNGLNRYDGYSIQVYKRNFANQNCISNNYINSIYEDTDNKLWILTAGGGLNVFDPDSGIFRQFSASENDTLGLSSNFTRDICQDKQGNYWIATRDKGLDMFDVRLGRFRNYRHDLNNHKSLSSNTLTTLCTDIDGNLWIGTWGGGLNLFSFANQSFIAFRHDPKDANSIASDFILKISSDSLGNIWVATRRGYSKLDSKTKTFRSYENVSGVGDSIVTAILPDRSGNIWIGTSEGLSLYDFTSQRIIKKYLVSSPGIGNQRVTSLCRDRSGVIWIGTERYGLLRLTYENFRTYSYDPIKYPGLQNNDIWSFCERADGNIWVGTGDGIFFFEPKKNLFTPRFQSVFKALSSLPVNVHALYDDGETLWAGTPYGLLEMDIRTGQYVQHRMNQQDSNSLSSNFVLCLTKDSTGNLWIGTQLGLNRMDGRSKVIKRYVNTVTGPAVLSDHSILSLYLDSKSALWVGTMNGLNRYDSKQDTFHIFKQNKKERNSISTDAVLSICEDKEGRMWLGTGSGISVIKPSGGFSKHIDEENGLPDNVIYSVLMDEQSNLWISSNRGLSKISHHDLEEIVNDDNTKKLRVMVKNYGKRDGLQSDEFNSGAFLRTQSKEMYFGGINGFSRFHPDRIEQNKYSPPVLITSVRAFEKEKKAGISKDNRIELTYDENMLTFEFIALDFTDPARNQYAYKLSDVDNDWNYSFSRRYATYSNLEPGTYDFFVKASNNDMLWSEGISLNIIIHPPYWKTWWFYALAAIFIFSAVWTAHKYRVRQKIKNTLEIERIRRFENERVRKKASDDFHDEFGHSLTKIAMLAEVLKRELHTINDENRTTLQKIIETSKMLSTGMRDFLWALNPGKDTFREVAIRIKDFGDELFDRTDTDFFVDTIPESYESYRLSMHVRRHIMLIFKEAMHNVLKHAGSKKTTLSFKIENNDFVIQLTDDGKGIHNNQEVQGLGIRSMHRRAKEISGTLNICSRHGEGTTVLFALPISSTQNTF